jgi:hypothetical protein
MDRGASLGDGRDARKTKTYELKPSKRLPTLKIYIFINLRFFENEFIF